MSGSLTPFVKLYDKFYFTPEREPCSARYLYDKALQEEEGIDIGVPTTDFNSYIQAVSARNLFHDELKYEKIEIVEKEPENLDIINNPIAQIPDMLHSQLNESHADDPAREDSSVDIEEEN